MPKSEAKWDAGFEKFVEKNPGATFAEYYVAGALSKIRDGRELATLGPSLRPHKNGLTADYHTAGSSTFRRYRKLTSLKPEQKLIDYGCGSLRIGQHFIQYLEPNHYFGLDVTRDFIAIGEGLLASLVEEKRPNLAAIGPASLAAAEAFGADVVYSCAVCCHVHPTEADAYFGNLRRLAGKSGAVLAFNVMMAPAPVRYHKSGWARPLDYYVDHLSPLRFVGKHYEERIVDERSSAGELSGMVLEFHNA